MRHIVLLALIAGALCATSFDGSGQFTLPFDPSGSASAANQDLPFDPSAAATTSNELPFDPSAGSAPESGGGDINPDHLDVEQLMQEGSSFDASSDFDIANMMNTVSDLPPEILNGGAPAAPEVPTGADNKGFDINALMNHVDGSVTPPPTPSFADQLHALQDDDPMLFGAYDGTGNIGGGSCMGGFVSELDLYVDCQKIMGFLAIVNSNEGNLDKLAKLTKIEKHADMAGPRGNGLYIANNTNLVDTSGLASLQSVLAGGLTIEDNPVLSSTGGIGNNLAHIGVNSDGESIVIRKNPALVDVGEWDLWEGAAEGGLTIDENIALTHLNGLHSVKKVGGAITIRFNPKLSDVSGLENVGAVGKDSQGNSVIIVHNDNLKDLTGLRGLQGMLSGAVKVSNNAALTSLDGLQAVLSIGRDAAGVALSVTNNAMLESLDALSGLTGKIDGSVVVMQNPSLKVLAGLQAISELGADVKGNSLQVAFNLVLSNLVGFEGLQRVGGAINITANPALKYLKGLDSLASIDGKNADGESLTVAANDALQSLKNLKGVHGELSGALSVLHNKALVSLDGLGGISAVNGKNIRGNALEVIMNDQLSDLRGLEGLRGHLRGVVAVDDNAQLEDLQGLCVDEVDGVDIQRNAQLKNVQGLRCTRKVNGATIINFNGELSDLLPLEEGLESLGGDVTVGGVKCISEQEGDLLKKKSSKANAKIVVATTTKGTCGEAANRKFGDASRSIVGAGDKAQVCGATSGKKSAWGKWEMLGSTGISMQVDTSNCAFKTTPNYVTSVYGDTAHWQLVGVNSIYEAKKGSFKVYAFHPVLRGSFMQYFAERYRWRLAWLADSGKTSGRTVAGNTGWHSLAKTKNVLYADVNTEKSGYAAPPRYVTSLYGGKNHWKAQGVHALYEPSRFGFRVFLVYPTAITPRYAEANDWSVAWVGSGDNAISGRSSATWTKFTPPRSDEKVEALFIDVDASSKHFASIPSYVTSISGKSHHWRVTGAGSIYSASAKGFRIYLDHANSVEFAKKNEWRVSYITARGSHDCHVSAWAGWEPCTKPCGGGRASRQRIVLEPAIGKGTCNFELAEHKACNTQRCVKNCTVQAWGAWGKCSKECGAGVRTRSRSIQQKPSVGGAPCPQLQEEDACDNGPCPKNCEVTPWGAWNSCSHSCGGGLQARARVVVLVAQHGGATCPTLREERQCNTQFCPIDCELNSWSDWGLCTKSCGWGMQTRTRTFKGNGAEYGGRACQRRQDIKPCHPDHCPVHCSVSPWSLFGGCSKTCGGGTRSRVRTVLQHAQHRGYSCPALSEVATCNTQSCAVDCAVTSWGIWAACSKSCGGGKQRRKRFVAQPSKHGGASCPPLKGERSCNSQSCPVDCETTAWTPWSHCSASCGTGTRWRMREVTTHVQFGGKDCSERFQQKACDSGPCAQDCEVGPWTAWTACDRTCGTGAQSRARSIVHKSKDGGAVCPGLTEHRECNTEFCPVDCLVSAWGAYGGCSKSCAGVGTLFQGQMTRDRTVVRKAAHGGKKCPALEQRTSCNTHPCPVDCEVTPWLGWSRCSATCGAGTRTRHRKVVVAASLGGRPCPQMVDTGTCDAGSCPEHCEVDPWSEWSICTQSCGSGSRTRSRNIVRHNKHGGFACPALFQVSYCNEHECPVDCELEQWGAWGVCSATCDQGIRTRVRGVKRPAAAGGRDCTGDEFQRIDRGSCDKGPCPSHCQVSPWGDWSACSASCTDDFGGGTRSRVRSVTAKGTHGGFVCPSLTETEPCNTQRCPVDCRMTQWGSWQPCSTTCSAGVQRRDRAVLRNHQHGGVACHATKETRTCNMGNCPKHCSVSAWQPWSACSKSCGAKGRQSRTRSVDSHAQHGGYTCPTLRQERQCNAHPCPVDCAVGNWYATGACSQACGGGSRVYQRDVTRRNTWGGVGCPLQSEQRPCNTEPCTVDCTVTHWGGWGACSHTCGSGTQHRMRRVARGKQHGGKACPPLKEGRGCNGGPCPSHCEVTAWSTWSGCTASCAGGTRVRERVVVKTAVYGGYVCPSLRQTRDCETQDCPVDCILSQWGSFSQCTKSCANTVMTGDSMTFGAGRMYKYRTVVRDPEWGGAECASLSFSQECNSQPCPVDCKLDNWGAWSPCSATCGRGVHMRSRPKLVRALFGGKPCGEMSQERACSDGPCPVHCEVSQWSSWRACTHTCGGGKRVRYRDITTHANHDGYVCPALYEQQTCNPHRCPIDCRTSAWGTYSACTKTCGIGQRTRERVVVIEPSFGGKGCPELSETGACKGNPKCPVHCAWSAWGAWQPCSKTCNAGTQKRARSKLTRALHGGLACAGKSTDSRSCHLEHCPVHCSVSSWGNWDSCSKTCGGGKQTHTRTVTQHAAHGGYTCPPLHESRECNLQLCPVDCVASPWSAWENFQGGGGLVTRSRTVVSPARHGGRSCAPLAERKIWHKVLECKKVDVYGMWSNCSRDCGGGHRYRYRRHVLCSSRAVVKLHMDFRQGALCNTRPCDDGHVPPQRDVQVPPAPAIDSNAAVRISPTQLSEELASADGDWEQRWV